jgi:hypothetical protein
MLASSDIAFSLYSLSDPTSPPTSQPSLSYAPTQYSHWEQWMDFISPIPPLPSDIFPYSSSCSSEHQETAPDSSISAPGY